MVEGNANTPPFMDLSSKSKSTDAKEETDDSPLIVTKEKQECHDKFKNIPVIIEGPEQANDFSYFL